jgi:hypothetical protein
MKAKAQIVRAEPAKLQMPDTSMHRLAVVISLAWCTGAPVESTSAKAGKCSSGCSGEISGLDVVAEACACSESAHYADREHKRLVVHD